jgi:hypothetical protein
LSAAHAGSAALFQIPDWFDVALPSLISSLWSFVRWWAHDVPGFGSIDGMVHSVGPTTLDGFIVIFETVPVASSRRDPGSGDAIGGMCG